MQNNTPMADKVAALNVLNETLNSLEQYKNNDNSLHYFISDAGKSVNDAIVQVANAIKDHTFV